LNDPAPRLLFVPVSGAFGMGEYARSLAIAQGAAARWPGASIQFILSRAAPYAAHTPFPTTLLSSSATFHSAAVAALIEAWRPDVVIFDNAGRTAQLRAARRWGARVVYISARPRQRAKAFRLRWMRIIDEHWIAYPQFIAGELKFFERLKLKLLGRPTIRYLDVVMARERATAPHAPGPERGLAQGQEGGAWPCPEGRAVPGPAYRAVPRPADGAAQRSEGGAALGPEGRVAPAAGAGAAQGLEGGVVPRTEARDLPCLEGTAVQGVAGRVAKGPQSGGPDGGAAPRSEGGPVASPKGAAVSEPDLGVAQGSASAGDYVLVVPGGGTGHPGAGDAVARFRLAAQVLADSGVDTVFVGRADPVAGGAAAGGAAAGGAAAGGAAADLAAAGAAARGAFAAGARLRLPGPLPQAQLAALMRGARLIIANGGSTLLQAIACGRPCIAVPIAGDQAERIRRCVAAGVAVAAPLDGAAIAQLAARLLRDDGRLRALAGRAAALALADGVDVALDALATLLAAA
jgi:hypothetical protein